MKQRSFFSSLDNAVNGIIQCLKRERNMRVHYSIAAFVLILSLFMHFTAIELMVLLISVAFVLVAEMVNTAIEDTVDMIKKDYDKRAGTIKDISAGAVIISALNAIVVGYLLFFKKFVNTTGTIVNRIKNAPIYLTLLAILITLLLSIGLKLIVSKKGRGTVNCGSSISIRSALAFALAGTLVHLNPDPLIMTLGFILALMVAEARFEAKKSSKSEIVWGGVLGFLLATLVFQIFR